eukprot:TRINITY_DN29833_c0_g1_i1.p1 TRINITY_DN29833_c0_g1~~TRINITY_DN29833_c0_g1_i1.p1  ORF type:complete len:348 (+),score=123.71 TRINITY_DN29833_c0_g1_i1:61-1104(+)
MPSNEWFYVTGTDTGFGAELVNMLAAKGHNTFAGHFMPKPPARTSGPGRVVEVHLDITSDESVAAAVKLIEATMGPEDVLAGVVNNAGLMLDCGPCEWTPIANYTKMYDVNVLGTARVAASALPLLRKSRGRIVNVASVAGRSGFAQLGAYCASKFAVQGYSEALRREIFPFGVSVHIVEPGVFAATGLYSTFHTGVEKHWSNLTPEVKAAYGEEFKNALAKYTTDGLMMLNNKDTSLVPKAYYHALTSPNPQMRYRCGTDSEYDVTVLTWLHDSWQDWILRLRATPPVMPSAGSDKASAQLAKRYGGWPLMRRLFLFLVLGLAWKFFTKRFGTPKIGPTGSMMLAK